MSHEYAFGPAKLIWDELVVPHTAAEAIASLEENHARLCFFFGKLQPLEGWGAALARAFEADFGPDC